MENKTENGMYCYKYPHPAVTTDCVMFGFDGLKMKVLLIRRGIEPYKGQWAFPGGFLHMDESAREGALRELQEETGLKDAPLRQFHTFSAPERDPRERVITIGYYALVRLSEVKGADDADEARWFAMDEIPSLAFDHDMILRTALTELRRQIHFEPVGFELLPEKFTIKQLQYLYETILDVCFDRRNFYNKMRHLDLLEQLDEKAKPTPKREAFLFRFRPEKYEELKEKGFRLEF
ncbi:MAG: NUDIX hydrolase [Prevotellaceae bacterium]|nr:NUDIX hydrolase [Prevotellaceae bacterium]MCD8303534.1 NUDIX hydrolase [Prevotellaceae bacterium]